MAMDSPAPNQMVSPTQVWAHLSTDLQLQIVHLFAQLAAHARACPSRACSADKKGDH